MSLFEQAKALGRAGRPEDGVRLIEQAAEHGDREGNVIVAHWHLYGSDRPRDPAAAHRHLSAAANAGSTQAVRILANLTGSGTGCEADWDKALGMLRGIAAVDPVAAAQLALLPAMMSLEEALDARRDRLSADPSIEVIHQLLRPEECAYVMRLAEPSVRPSTIFDAATGRGKPDPIRTSHGAGFLPHDEDLVLQQINRRIALVTGTAIDHAEALYVMRYTPGQEYKPHLDALAGIDQQRAWTAICYLNDGYGGGETVFPELGISVRGEAGDMLVFSNVDAEGKADFRMRHGGLPVSGGVKWIATRWIRQGRHDPYDVG